MGISKSELNFRSNSFHLPLPPIQLKLKTETSFKIELSNIPSVTRGPQKYLCSYKCQHRISCRGIPLVLSVDKPYTLWTLHIDFSTAGRILTDVDLSSFHQPQAWSPLRYLAFSYSLVIWFPICFSHISGRSCSSAHAAWCVIGFGCVKSSPFGWGINRSSSALRLPIETSTNCSQMYYYTQPSVKMIFSLQRYFQSAMTE